MTLAAELLPPLGPGVALNVDQLSENVTGNKPLADDSDSEEVEDDGAHQPVLESDKRTAQTAVFKAHVATIAQETTKADRAAELKEAKDAELSAIDILAKQEQETIKDPREYQIELFERAKNENIVAVLDTGSGKTLIAVLLLRYILDNELEDRAKGLKPRLAFFLVPSITLAFQQYTVLECNLDYKIQRRFGNMRTDSWEKKVWEKHLADDMVIVCTPEILNQCLLHSFVTMDQINLLIFDEAHHAKKNNPYATIIRTFYNPMQNSARRPRIFGMTASPVDAKTDVTLAAGELEGLLNCKIATTPLSDDYKNKAQEYIDKYPRLPAPFETLLYQEMEKRFGDMEVFSRLFKASKAATVDIGRWGSDKFWSFALADEQVKKTELKINRQHGIGTREQSIKKLDDDVARLREAQEFISSHHFGSPTESPTDLSMKVLRLHMLLSAHYERHNNNRCIVFVERRATARLLQLIFEVIGGPHLRVGLLTGLNSLAGDPNVSFRQQVLTMKQFRDGELNCLFATSVAEEGLDIPDCNLIIRFDLCKTMIQFIQSKGRARHKNSKYIEMLEVENVRHMQAVSDTRDAAKIMRNWCKTLPADRMLRGNDFDWEANDKNRGRVFTHPATGAKLTYSASLVVLSHFTSSLGFEEKNHNSEPSYIMSVDQSRYICEVVLPGNSPVRTARGLRYRKKSLAKRSAAFQMCCELLKRGFLDENLMSVYKKKVRKWANAQLALNSKKPNMYAMRLKPSLWEQGRGTMPSELYLTILDVSNGLHRPHQPIGLLSRSRLPKLPQFPLFLDHGKITMVVTRSLQKPLKVTPNVVDQITNFTLRLWKDVNAKKFEVNSVVMSYWVVPIDENGRLMEKEPVANIDWKTIKTVFDNDEYPWTPNMPHGFLAGKLLVDRWSGNRRFFSTGVNPGLKPLDLVPENAVKPVGPGGKHRKNILQYSISLWGKAGQKKFAECDLEQPIVEADQILHRQNLLAESKGDEQGRLTKAFLCPQPLRISALPVTVVVMFTVFPAIIHRIEDYLIALETCDLVDIKVNPDLALEAVTKDSDNSGDHDEERINFRPGMGKNYERLEFMGDCFLKMATSISLFGQRPNDDEFDFHVNRMTMICNQNLFQSAMKLNLTEYVRTMAFSRRLWYPEGLKLLEGKGANKAGTEVIKHPLGDKSVADVCEALIGAAFIQYNEPGAWKPENWTSAIKTVTKFVDNGDHLMQNWDDYISAYNIPEYQTLAVTAAQRALADSIYKEHGYHFNYPRLLRSAFCHPSQPYIWEKIPSYQRLEFLGDSLLDTVCVTHLFYRYPTKDPKWLTEHKMAMVANKFLGALCVKLEFHRHLRYCNSQLQSQIQDYVIEVSTAAADAAAEGAVDYWIGVRDPPKCLPDIVEAYVGAIFIDSGFNYNEVQRFFDKHMKPFFEDMTVYDTFAKNHPTTHLYNLLSTSLGCQYYRLMTEELPAKAPGMKPKVVAGVVVHLTVLCVAEAESGRYAKLAASKNALGLLQGLAAYEFREKYGCDCRAKGSVDEWPDQVEGQGVVEVNGAGLAEVGTAI